MDEKCGCHTNGMITIHSEKCQLPVLRAEVQRLHAANRELVEALDELVQCNERWNEAVTTIIGRHPTQFEDYLYKAKGIVVKYSL